MISSEDRFAVESPEDEPDILGLCVCKQYVDTYSCVCVCVLRTRAAVVVVVVSVFQSSLKSTVMW